MPSRIGSIMTNEGMTVVKEGGVGWNEFMVNRGKPIPVYNGKYSYKDYTIRYMSAGRGYAVGYIRNSPDFIRNQCVSFDNTSVAPRTTIGGSPYYARVTARYALAYFDRYSRRMGTISAGEELGIYIGDGGASAGSKYPDRMLIKYRRQPGMSWASLGSSGGWVNTGCAKNGYSGNWGIDHLRN